MEYPPGKVTPNEVRRLPLGDLVNLERDLNLLIEVKCALLHEAWNKERQHVLGYLDSARQILSDKMECDHSIVPHKVRVGDSTDLYGDRDSDLMCTKCKTTWIKKRVIPSYPDGGTERETKAQH